MAYYASFGKLFKNLQQSFKRNFNQGYVTLFLLEFKILQLCICYEWIRCLLDD